MLKLSLHFQIHACFALWNLIFLIFLLYKVIFVTGNFQFSKPVNEKEEHIMPKNVLREIVSTRFHCSAIRYFGSSNHVSGTGVGTPEVQLKFTISILTLMRKVELMKIDKKAANNRSSRLHFILRGPMIFLAARFPKDASLKQIPTLSRQHPQASLSSQVCPVQQMLPQGMDPVVFDVVFTAVIISMFDCSFARCRCCSWMGRHRWLRRC